MEAAFLVMALKSVKTFFVTIFLPGPAWAKLWRDKSRGLRRMVERVVLNALAK